MQDAAAERLCKAHLMIPVMIESGFDQSRGEPDLVDTIRGRLENLIGQKEARALVLRLLKHRRILVTLDSFSEWDEASPAKVNPGTADFPVKALIVTSRMEEWT